MLWKFYFNLISASLLCTLSFFLLFSSETRGKKYPSLLKWKTLHANARVWKEEEEEAERKKKERRERERRAPAPERERERERAERARERECESERESSIVCVVRFGTVVGRERVSVLALRLALE